MIALNEPLSNGRYEPGDLVRHRRYGYRGVVVSVDDICQADEAWYQKNQTRPDRDQPWHHVLVHETSTVTYAAGDNLLPEIEVAPIQHPLVEHFFAGFDGQKYIRNERQWPAN
jgi:heat shock protein HspQ